MSVERDLGNGIKAIVSYSGSLGLEIKKPKVGAPYVKCPCGVKHTLDDSWIKSAQTVKHAKEEYGVIERYESHIEGFSAVEAARRFRERQNRPADDFVEKSRDFKIASQMSRGADTLVTSRYVYCRCGRKLPFTIEITHNQPIPEQLTFIELLEKYPLKPTKLTLFIFQRLSYAQGYGTPKEFLDMVNGLHNDLQALDKETKKVEKVLTAFNSHSKLVSDSWVSMRERWLEEAEEVREDLKKQLELRLQQIFDDSNTSLPGEEAEGKQYKKYP